jgi:hypothetical protein
MICHYCGRTWHVRLCPRGHENPPDAQFCGICGSADLTDTAGPIPFWIWLIRIGTLVILVMVILCIASLDPPEFHLNDQIIAQLIAIAILIFAINISLSVMPVPVRRGVLKFTKILKKWLIRVIGWCWEKVKIMLS